jgi:uncharacterized protein YuzE
VSKATRAYYDRKADVLSIDIRSGEPRHVAVVRGTVVIYADDKGIYAIDIEAEKWDTDDVDKQLKLMNVDVL